MINLSTQTEPDPETCHSPCPSSDFQHLIAATSSSPTFIIPPGLSTITCDYSSVTRSLACSISLPPLSLRLHGSVFFCFYTSVFQSPSLSLSAPIGVPVCFSPPSNCLSLHFVAACHHSTSLFYYFHGFYLLSSLPHCFRLFHRVCSHQTELLAPCP